jgi:GNAT superfamily N-acetyltransferase
MDLLVKLYALPGGAFDLSGTENVEIRRAFAAEKILVTRWVEHHFGRGWASEAEAAFTRLPIACFVATAQSELVGFACYDATARGFFGPMGVAEARRGHGVGRALLSRTLRDMTGQGYAYAIVGGTGSEEFYRREAGAIEIPDSAPGFYRGMLKE